MRVRMAAMALLLLLLLLLLWLLLDPAARPGEGCCGGQAPPTAGASSLCQQCVGQAKQLLLEPLHVCSSGASRCVLRHQEQRPAMPSMI